MNMSPKHKNLALGLQHDPGDGKVDPLRRRNSTSLSQHVTDKVDYFHLENHSPLPYQSTQSVHYFQVRLASVPGLPFVLIK